MSISAATAARHRAPPGAVHRVWSVAPTHPPLGPGEVHVWRARLRLPAADVRGLEALLSADERKRAAGFRFAEDRDAFVAARGLLRTLLARYLGTSPAEPRLRYGRQGKPALDADPGLATVHFNLSHSSDLALLAFSSDIELGVDIERLRRNLAYEMIAARFFAPSETAALRRLPPEQRRPAFFVCWTRKEAVLKATGEGASRPPESFEVTLGRYQPPAVASIDGSPAAGREWFLADLHPGAGYAGALALRGSPRRLRCYAWPAHPHRRLRLVS